LAPENQISYDTQQFYNSALAIALAQAPRHFAFRLFATAIACFSGSLALTLT